MYQALDKLFGTWHETYLCKVKDWRANHPGLTVSRDLFLQFFEETWHTWCTPAAIEDAFKRVGWANSGVELAIFPDESHIFKVSATFQEYVCPA
jgi:hypothetical protein